MKNFSSHQEIHKYLKDGKGSVKELVQYYLNRIELNKELNAFLDELKSLYISLAIAAILGSLAPTSV